MAHHFDAKNARSTAEESTDVLAYLKLRALEARDVRIARKRGS